VPAAVTNGRRRPVEGHDFVICSVCGVQRLDLTKHLASHNMDAATYAATYRGRPLMAHVLVELRRKKRKSSGSSRLVHIREIIPEVVSTLKERKSAENN